MRRSFYEIYIHLIWATKDRECFICDEIQTSLWSIVKAKCEKHNIELIAQGNTEDHIHLLLSIKPDTNVSAFVKEVKGSSSHYTNKDLHKTLYWQDGYGALSVSKSDVDKIKHYVENQVENHRKRKDFVTVLERVEC